MRVLAAEAVTQAERPAVLESRALIRALAEAWAEELAVLLPATPLLALPGALALAEPVAVPVPHSLLCKLTEAVTVGVKSRAVGVCREEAVTVGSCDAPAEAVARVLGEEERVAAIVEVSTAVVVVQAEGEEVTVSRPLAVAVPVEHWLTAVVLEGRRERAALKLAVALTLEAIL
jgi:hypothetical protein